MAVLSYLEAIRAAMSEEMERDPRVFLMGEDIGAYGGAFGATEGLFEKFGPERVIDMPMSETAIVGAGIGAAAMGMRPIVEMQFIDFISCAFDMIVNYAAKSRYRWNVGIGMVIRGPAGGNVHGGPFHSQNPEGYFLNVPGLKIVAPSTPSDAKGLLTAAIRDADPVLFLEHKHLYRRVREEVPEGDHVVPIGKARLARVGEDVSIITYGAMVQSALDAAQEAAGDGIDVAVVDLRTLAPLDHNAIIQTVARTGKVIVLHEATRTGGPGGEIAALISERAFEYLDAPVVRLAAPDTPVPYAPTLEAEFLPSVEKIGKCIRALYEY